MTSSLAHPALRPRDGDAASAEPPWAREAYLRCVPRRYQGAARTTLEHVAALDDAGLLIKEGRPVSAAELDTIAAVVRQSVARELAHQDREARRSRWAGLALYVVALVGTSGLTAWSLERGVGWGVAFFFVQLAATVVWVLVESAALGRLWTLPDELDHLRALSRLDWLIRVKLAGRVLWIGVGLVALAVVRFDLSGAPGWAHLAMAVPVTGVSVLVFTGLRFMWALAFGVIGRLLGARAWDPYPALVLNLLEAAYWLPLLSSLHDETLHSLFRTLDAIADGDVDGPGLDEAARTRAREAADRLLHVHSYRDVQHAERVVRELVGDRRTVARAELRTCGEALPHEDFEGPVWKCESRRYVAALLEAAAQIQGRLTTSVGGRDQAAYRLSAHATRVAAWLRAREAEVLLPSPTGVRRLHQSIASGFVAASLGDWPAIESEPCPAPRHVSIAQLAKRFLLPLALAAAAFAVPTLLDLPAGDATSAVQLSLAGSAVLALFAPATAVRDATEAARNALTQEGNDGAGSGSSR